MRSRMGKTVAEIYREIQLLQEQLKRKQQEVNFRSARSALKLHRRELSRQLHPRRAKFQDLVGREIKSGKNFKSAVKAAKRIWDRL